MSVIAEATADDLSACLDMGARFFEESGFAAETSFDAESTLATLEHLMTDPDGCLLVAKQKGEIVGMAGAMAYPHYFNRDSKTAQELFWWVAPAARGGMAGVRLLLGLEAWAKGRGCGTLTMVCLTIKSPAERIYARMGYRAAERSFLKRL